MYRYTEPDTWHLLQELFRVILDKVEDWDEIYDRDSANDEKIDDDDQRYGSIEDLESEKTLLLKEEFYQRKALSDAIEVLSWKLKNEIQDELAESFSELESICSELDIDIVDEYERIQTYVDVLLFEGGPLIYVPKHELIYAPQLILAVNDELIGRIARDPEILFKIPPRKFEEIIAEVFHKRGYAVELTKSTRDGGRDIIAIHENLNISTKYLIECKRYAKSNKVSIGMVQRLFGVKLAEAANKAILATTSTFTKDARVFASKHVWDLDLKEYEDIMHWIRTYG